MKIKQHLKTLAHEYISQVTFDRKINNSWRALDHTPGRLEVWILHFKKRSNLLAMVISQGLQGLLVYNLGLSDYTKDLSEYMLETLENIGDLGDSLKNIVDVSVNIGDCMGYMKDWLESIGDCRDHMKNLVWQLQIAWIACLIHLVRVVAQTVSYLSDFLGPYQ